MLYVGIGIPIYRNIIVGVISSDFNILTEASDNLLTEAGDNLVQEAA